MEGRYRKNKSKTGSRFYILMSIVFVFVMFKWGIPLFVNIVSGPESKSEQSAYSDSIPPQTPVLSALPEATNSSSLTVSGFTQPSATCQLVLNDAVTDEVTADVQGYFEFLTKLSSGDNTVMISAKNEQGLSSQSQINVVNYDNSAVKISEVSPSDGESIFGLNNKNIKVSGKINKEKAVVLVNGAWASVSGGVFSSNFTLNDGDNEIKIEVTDSAGNTTSTTIKVKYLP